MATRITIVFNRLPEIAAKLPREVGEIVMKTAFDVQQAAQESMSGPKSGRTYRRGGKMHQASAPGEAPAVDTGDLANSIKTEQTGPTSAIVGVGAKYGAPLEFGTSRIRKRPFMGPAAEANRQAFIDAMMDLEMRLR